MKDRLLNPVRTGPIDDATHVGQSGVPGEGRFIKLWLLIENDLVLRAAWASNGCPAMIAAASAVAELSEHKITSNLLTLSEGDIHGVIGPLSEGKEYAATEAILALRNAIGGIR